MQENTGIMLDNIDSIRQGLKNAAITLDMLIECIQMDNSDPYYDSAAVSVVSGHLKQLDKIYAQQLEDNIHRLSESNQA